jgi:hypothetical protein
MSAERDATQEYVDELLAAAPELDEGQADLIGSVIREAKRRVGEHRLVTS